MAEQDFSKVVQQLQIANQKLANLERLQSEGGTAKGIIAAALPEVLNERQIFGQEKQFQKDEGITKVDELQQDTTDAVNELKETSKVTAKQQSLDIKKSNEIQIAQSFAATDAFSKMNANDQQKMIADEVARQERIKEVEKERKESRDNFRRLEARIGKSNQITKDAAKAEEEFSKRFLDLELQNPLLDPSQQKALEKRRAAMDAKGLRGAFSGIKKSFDNFASPLKKFLGAGTGIPGFSVGKLGLIFIAIPLLITFLRSEAFQTLIDLLKGPAGFVLDLFVSGVKLIFDQFTRIGEGIKKLSEGDLSGIGDILGGGGTLAVALAGILIILRPFKSLIASTISCGRLLYISTMAKIDLLKRERW